MSLRRPAKEQPETFEFNSSSLEAANAIVSKYPKGKQQSAVMALLYIAQKQNDNWIPLVAMKYIAKFLDMPYLIKGMQFSISSPIFSTRYLGV